MKDLLTLIEDEQLALIAVFKNAVQQLYRIGWVFAEDFCHRIVMRPIFHCSFSCFAVSFSNIRTPDACLKQGGGQEGRAAAGKLQHSCFCRNNLLADGCCCDLMRTLFAPCKGFFIILDLKGNSNEKKSAGLGRFDACFRHCIRPIFGHALRRGGRGDWENERSENGG